MSFPTGSLPAQRAEKANSARAGFGFFRHLPMGFLTAAAGLLPSSAVVIIRLSEGFVKGAGLRPGGMPLFPPCPRPAFPDAFAARFYAMEKVQKRGVSTIVTNCICSISKKNGQRRFFQKADLVRLVARAFARGSLLQANLIAEEGCKMDTPFPGPWKHISRNPRMLYWFWTPEILHDEKYLKDLKRIDEKSAYTWLSFLPGRAWTSLTGA